MSTRSDVTLFVCTTCKTSEPDAARSGHAFHQAIEAELRARAEHRIALVPIECLSVCKRPCTVALAGTGKWTYLFGDLATPDQVGDVITVAIRYGASENGIVPWRERPPAIRRGIVARVPPPSFRPEEPKE